MVTVHLNIPISTIEYIMSTVLYTWNPLDKDKQTITAEAETLTYDTFPVVYDGRITHLLDINSGDEHPINRELLISRDTPISDALTLLASSPYASFLVLYGQTIQGIITPSDFNKVTARSYFYNLLAVLEMELAERTRAYYSDTNDIVTILQPSDKTIAQYRKAILSRSSSTDRKTLGLDLIHSLMLGELEDLIKKDGKFRTHLGFRDELHYQTLFDGINGSFRRKVMHPTKPLLNDAHGLVELNRWVHQTIRLINLLSTDPK